MVAKPITFPECSSCSKQSTRNFPKSYLEMLRPGDLSYIVWNGADGSSKENRYRIENMKKIMFDKLTRNVRWKHCSKFQAGFLNDFQHALMISIQINKHLWNHFRCHE